MHITNEDLSNILSLINRSQFNGLNEAKAAVVLEQHISAELTERSAPPAPPAEEGETIHEIPDSE